MYIKIELIDKPITLKKVLKKRSNVSVKTYRALHEVEDIYLLNTILYNLSLQLKALKELELEIYKQNN